MYRLSREEFLKAPAITFWSLLGFQAGYINAIGFLTCGRYVSHLTGVGSQLGAALAEGRPWIALELIGVPFFFVSGAFTSGLATSARIERGLKPFYGLVTLLIPVLLLAVMFLGNSGFFGSFSESSMNPGEFVFLYLLSFVCGVQNGCFATLTRGQIRTTHLTGISTDLGTDLARLWMGGIRGSEQRLTQRINLSRICTIVAFASGSVVSIQLAQDYLYGALTVPILTSTLSAAVVNTMTQLLDRREAHGEGVQTSGSLTPIRT